MKEIIYLVFLGAFGGLMSAWTLRFWREHNLEKICLELKIDKKFFNRLRILFEAIIFLLLFLLFYIVSLINF